MFTTHSVTPGLGFQERDVCVFTRVQTVKGPLDSALFTHPDRQRAVKNCSIFPLKSLLILRSNVFTAASLFSTVCVYVSLCVWAPLCVCILFFFFLQNVSWKTKSRCQLFEAQRDGEERVLLCSTNFSLLSRLPLPPSLIPPLLRHLLVIICLCKSLNMIHGVISSPPPQEMSFLAFWGAYLIENMILTTRWLFAACETWMRPPLYPIRSQSSMMTALCRQGGEAAATAPNNRLITLTMSGDSVTLPWDVQQCRKVWGYYCKCVWLRFAYVCVCMYKATWMSHLYIKAGAVELQRLTV